MIRRPERRAAALQLQIVGFFGVFLGGNNMFLGEPGLAQ